MSKQLGIGVRVWCGWCSTDQVLSERADPRLKVGTITDGPYHPGENNFGVVYKETSWVVMIGGVRFGSVSSLLTPIDDDEESVTELAEVDSKITEGETA